MTTKEKVKRRIDNLPEENIKKVEEFLNKLSSVKVDKKNLTLYDFKGQFDNKEIRNRAYE
ncbi:MAG: hypothetical protein SCALA702_38130 [Melioribacteraceae bacterium]|nr:MAG: hypothetical protein SCALA702_38130 [Melioribacteraceae bacterium]